jgi:hypothetical protein
VIFSHHDFQDFTYRTATHAESRVPSVQQTVPQCPIECNLYELVNVGAYRTPLPYNNRVMNFNRQTGSIDISTQDQSWRGSSMSMVLECESTESFESLN